METPRVTEAEIKVMDVLWESGGVMQASDITVAMEQRCEWAKNTTYTVLNRLAAKKVISKNYPRFTCTALYSKEQISISEAKSLLHSLCGGSLGVLVSAFVNGKGLSEGEIAELRRAVDI